jgi:hypothetical protein
LLTFFVFALVALFMGSASAAENNVVDFSVVFDRTVYYRGETPRILVSAPAELVGKEFGLAIQFEGGVIVKINSRENRLAPDASGAVYTGAFRPVRDNDQGMFRYFVTLNGVTKVAEYKVVAGERPAPLHCSGDNSVKTGDTVMFRATGGTQKYQWVVPIRSDGGYGFVEGVLAKEDTLLLKPGPLNVGRLERRFVAVSDGNETAVCLLEVVKP